jgi:prolipoprotein diacylglyceryltransferase
LWAVWALFTFCAGEIMPPTIAATNARWTLQFRFAVHIIRPRVSDLDVRPHSHATMTYHSTWWSKAAVVLVSIILACLVTTFFLPPDYRHGGGAVAVVTIVTYLIFRFVIEFFLNRMQKKDKE